jgi:hypothetical protein
LRRGVFWLQPQKTRQGRMEWRWLTSKRSLCRISSNSSVGFYKGEGATSVSEPVELSNDHIHVWMASLDVSPELLERFRSTLSAEELERAPAISISYGDRARFSAGRGILQHLLGSYLRMAPERLSFCYTEYGKPAALSGQYADAGRAISHGAPERG